MKMELEMIWTCNMIYYIITEHMVINTNDMLYNDKYEYAILYHIISL